VRRDADVVVLRAAVPWPEWQPLETCDLVGVGDVLGEATENHAPTARRIGFEVINLEGDTFLSVDCHQLLARSVWNTTLRPSTA
jgi:hypothetical protein